MSSASLIIGWRRAVEPATSVVAVYIGDAVGQYYQRFEGTVNANVPDAFVRLTGLNPLTKFYYTVCSLLVCAPPAADMYFTTSPAYGVQQPVRIHVLGDPGKGYGAGTLGLNAAAAFMGPRPADFWLQNGDNAYNRCAELSCSVELRSFCFYFGSRAFCSGTDTEYTNKNLNFAGFKNYLKRTPLWTTLGNHDDASNVRFKR